MMGVVMIRCMVILGIVVLLVAGCEREEATPQVPEPPVVDLPEMEEPEEDEEDPAEEPWEPEAAAFLGWPGQGEGRTFGLTWLGGDEVLELLEEPRHDSVVAGRLRWLDGEELDWRESRVEVVEPRALQVVEPVVFFGFPYDVEFREIESEGRSVELSPEQVVFFYHDAGEGQCFLGVDGEIYLGECPEGALEPLEPLDPGAQMLTPLRALWWVLISEDVEGWMEVMEAPLEVYEREIEGVERPDVGDEF